MSDVPRGFPTNPPWVGQFRPAPPVGTAYAPRPVSPRGIYEFGAPEIPIRIHFPDDGRNSRIAEPWYWFYPTQQPQAFSFLAGVWGPGWVRQPTFPVIKILAIDTQPIVPIPEVGWPDLEAAARAGNTASFGRIDFRPPHLWMLGTNQSLTGEGVVQDKPKYTYRKGLLIQTQPNSQTSSSSLNGDVEQFVTRWQDRWNSLANTYNAIASTVNPASGFQYPTQGNVYQILLPSGPPTTLTQFSTQLALFASQARRDGRYMGPVPGSAFFNINTFTTQAYAFTIRVGQLNAADWDMSVFPPREARNSLTIKPSSVTGDFSGFALNAPPIPFAGPQLI